MNKRILVVDDNRLIVNLLRVNLISSGYDVITASDGFSALRIAINERPDLVLLDVMMPEMDGFEVARQIRNNTLIAHVPIIMLTARGSVDSVVEGLDAGADDYVSKPFEMTEVLARVKAHLRRSRSERSLSPMTGLPGNVTIEQELKQIVERQRAFAVVYADIDNFKSYNDSYGFLQGDEAIKLLAQCILSSVQSFGNPHDFVGHIGGDDFVICTTPDRVDGICQDIIGHFEHSMRALYRPEHREQGYVVGINRSGQEVRHALITLSLAVVTNEHREITSHWEIGEIAAELKRGAKAIEHSIYIKDLRRGSHTAACAPKTNNLTLPPVVLLTKDPVLTMVAPTTFKRVGLELIVVNSILEVPEARLSAVIVDTDLVCGPELYNLIAQWNEGTELCLLESTPSESTSVQHCFTKPWNINCCAMSLRDIAIKERENAERRTS